jgi:hypothetical protein
MSWLQSNLWLGKALVAIGGIFVVLGTAGFLLGSKPDTGDEATTVETSTTKATVAAAKDAAHAATSVAATATSAATR